MSTQTFPFQVGNGKHLASGYYIVCCKSRRKGGIYAVIMAYGVYYRTTVQFVLQVFCGLCLAQYPCEISHLVLALKDTLLWVSLELLTSVSVFGVQIRACGGGVYAF